ncbi:predicted protein [Streptomyces viridochromogenes DSM 40736]|uniref:Predicted protein n=1 Tax=Streptomyces viridochromogenes (strain DSM 40736 / JCM 4977 / BCRC 1201 / Tue 494) TaxID=591159 RepID=D9X9I8_STRVT|nr:predicted protein [Streptomyces viridochromogenes DSM 40736]
MSLRIRARIDALIAWTDLGSMLDTDPLVLRNSRVTPRLPPPGFSLPWRPARVPSDRDEDP